jgi:hypothetical protein
MNEQMSMPKTMECEMGPCVPADNSLRQDNSDFLMAGDASLATGGRSYEIAACGRNARFGYTVLKNRCHTVRYLRSFQDLCVSDVTQSE